MFTTRVANYCLLDKLRVTLYFTSYELLLLERVTSYVLTMSYNKNKHDEIVDDNKVMIKNYSLGSFFAKELGVA